MFEPGELNIGMFWDEIDLVKLAKPLSGKTYRVDMFWYYVCAGGNIGGRITGWEYIPGGDPEP